MPSGYGRSLSLTKNTGCPKKTWEFSDEFDIVFNLNLNQIDPCTDLVTHCKHRPDPLYRVSPKTWEFSEELDIVFVMNKHCNT